MRSRGSLRQGESEAEAPPVRAGSRQNCVKRSGRVGAFSPVIHPVALVPAPKSPHGSFPALCGLSPDGSVPASAPQCHVVGSMNPAATKSAESRSISAARSRLAMSSGQWAGWKLIHESTIMVEIGQSLHQGPSTWKGGTRPRVDRSNVTAGATSPVYAPGMQQRSGGAKSPPRLPQVGSSANTK